MKLIFNPKHPEVIGVRDVKVLNGHTVHVTFTNGVERDIDLEPNMWGPVFEPIRNDPKLFAAVFVDPIGQTLAWPNGVDLAPETLYYGDTPPPWAIEDTSPKRRGPHRASSPQPRRSKRRTRVRASR